MQGTQVCSLVQEDPTCRGGSWACEPQLLSLYARFHAPQQERSAQWEAQALQLESCHNSKKSNKDPAENKLIFFKKAKEVRVSEAAEQLPRCDLLKVSPQH